MLSDKTPIPEAPKVSKEPDPQHVYRVEKVHGGKVVEEIERPEPMNNPECAHNFVLDPTETDFIGYICDKPDCGIVMIYDK